MFITGLCILKHCRAKSLGCSLRILCYYCCYILFQDNDLLRNKKTDILFDQRSDHKHRKID